MPDLHPGENVRVQLHALRWSGGAGGPPFTLERIDGSRSRSINWRRTAPSCSSSPTRTARPRRSRSDGSRRSSPAGAGRRSSASPRRRRHGPLASPAARASRFPMLPSPHRLRLPAYGSRPCPRPSGRARPGHHRYRRRLGRRSAMSAARHRRSRRGARRKPGCGARWTYEARGPRRARGHVRARLERRAARRPSDAERVEAMLGGANPALSLGPVPPAHGEATLERLAACAVLAGCRPAYFPVVRAAAGGGARARFNAHGIAVTTQPRRHDPRRQRPGARTARHQQRHGCSRPGHPCEHDDRPRAATAAHPHRRRPPGRSRPLHAR